MAQYRPVSRHEPKPDDRLLWVAWALCVGFGLIISVVTVLVFSTLFEKVADDDADGFLDLPFIDFVDGGSDSTTSCRPGYSKYTLPGDFMRDECLLTRPFPSSVDQAIVDNAVNPCDNMLLHSCGGWFDHSPSPSDRNFGTMSNYVDRLLQEVESIEIKRMWDRGPLNRFFHSCVDSLVGVETSARANQQEIEVLLELASGVTTRGDLPAVFGKLQRRGFTTPLFIEPEFNPLNTDEPLLYLEQNGLFVEPEGLGAPGHEAFLVDLFIDAGFDAGAATQGARLSAEVEQHLLQAWVVPSTSNLDHYISSGEFDEDRLSFAQLEQLAPGISWPAWLEPLGPLAFQSMVSGRGVWASKVPYIQALDGLLASTLSLDHWVAFVQASILVGSAWALPTVFGGLHPMVAPPAPPHDFPAPGIHNDLVTLPWKRRRLFHPSQSPRTSRIRVSASVRASGHSRVDFSPYPLPSDVDFSGHKEVCLEITRGHLSTVFDEWYVRMRVSDPNLVRITAIANQIKAETVQMAREFSWATPRDRELLARKVNSTSIRIALPENERDPWFFRDGNFDSPALLANINEIVAHQIG